MTSKSRELAVSERTLLSIAFVQGFQMCVLSNRLYNSLLATPNANVCLSSLHDLARVNYDDYIAGEIFSDSSGNISRIQLEKSILDHPPRLMPLKRMAGGNIMEPDFHSGILARSFNIGRGQMFSQVDGNDIKEFFQVLVELLITLCKCERTNTVQNVFLNIISAKPTVFYREFVPRTAMKAAFVQGKRGYDRVNESINRYRKILQTIERLMGIHGACGKRATEMIYKTELLGLNEYIFQMLETFRAVGVDAGNQLQSCIAQRHWWEKVIHSHVIPESK